MKDWSIEGMENLDEYILGDKANIAVIGGGPTGSFSAFCAQNGKNGWQGIKHNHF